MGADTADSWRLVTPAQLSLVSIVPDSMSNGQNVSFAAQVHDSGQANVKFVGDSTYLDFGAGQILSTQGGTILGNTTKTLN
ncbi:MAG: hypothetical protein GWN00_25470, partial [Aliifodinibius sp.]|nr:hypothetical protein [Fodinibius sp.]NIY28028.1 hypothetical protein [Fodinibius sp.]